MIGFGYLPLRTTMIVLGCTPSADEQSDVSTVEKVDPLVEIIEHHKREYRVVNISTQTHQIDLIGNPNAQTVASTVKQQDSMVLPIALMNAGMFHPDHRPVGLEILEGEITSSINLDTGQGNFFLLPNGVFAVDRYNHPHILSSTTFDPSLHWRFATQSGPLLLQDGVYHSKLVPTSSNLHIRNGVCISETHIHWVISLEPVRFYDLASLMRDVLDCRDGLYLDGAVSKLYYRVDDDWNVPISQEELGNWLVLYPKNKIGVDKY